MEKLQVIKKWISNLLTFYSETPKNTSLNEKNIKNIPHEEKIIMSEKGLLKIKSSNEDNITLDLCDLNVSLSRFIATDVPHEVSIFVPRAEIRKTIKNGKDKEYTSEVILNSITIVHSPNKNKDEDQNKAETTKEVNKDSSKESSKETPEKPADTNKPKTQIGFKYLLNNYPYNK